MTWFQSLAIKFLMLAVAVGILYWAVQQGSDPALDQSPASSPPTAVTRGTVQEAPLVAEGPENNDLPPPVVTPSAPAPPPGPSRSTSPQPTTPAVRPVTFPLDINAAKVEDFMALPGIGETLARRLVDYRKRHGGFRSVEDLRQVRGIGEKRMEQIRPLVKTVTADE